MVHPATDRASAGPGQWHHAGPGRADGRRPAVRLAGMRRWRTATAALGPAFVAAVAYVDPGNVATNVTAGAKYGTLLLWVVVAASAVGVLVQYLSAKLGAVTGLSLAELCRDHMPAPVRIGMWLQAELVVIMTDLAEIVGGAIALQLLFGLPLLLGAVIMVAAVFGILAVHVRDQDAFRPVVYVCLAVVAVGFGYQAVRAGLSPARIGSGLVPRLAGTDSAYLAAGIVGATVMPHVVYLHSDMTTRVAASSVRSVGQLVRRMRREILAAMLLATFVNVAIMLAATVLAPADADSIGAAHAAFILRTGAFTGLVFAVALLASSLASTCVGVYSGQVIMKGFLQRQVSVWVRRTLSVLPALAVLALGVNATDALVLSQVCLSFGIPFALAPLIWFTSRRTTMRAARNLPATIAVSVIVLGFVIGLNGFLVWQVAQG